MIDYEWLAITYTWTRHFILGKIKIVAKSCEIFVALNQKKGKEKVQFFHISREDEVEMYRIYSPTEKKACKLFS